MAINIEKTDPYFKFEVAETPGGENITRCFACGTCTIGCPVREVDERYNPRRIIRMILLGMRDEVLKSDFIWLCTSCYTCSERCPQDVMITELMTAVKNLAVKYGYVHPSYREQIKALKDFEGLYEVSDFDNRKRKKMGLPEIRRDRKVLKEIIEKTGLTRMVGGEE